MARLPQDDASRLFGSEALTRPGTFPPCAVKESLLQGSREGTPRIAAAG